MAYYDYIIKTKFPCGCQIRQKMNDDLFIEYCSKHKAAPDIYEALENLREILDNLIQSGTIPILTL